MTFDPGSPTGKEYAIPLETARQEASGHTDGPSTRGERGSAPLFGEGVGDSPTDPETTSSGGQANSGASKKPTKSSRPKVDELDPGSARKGSADGAQPLRAAGVTTAGGTSDMLTIGAVALAVLLLGGVIGSIARRRDA